MKCPSEQQIIAAALGELVPSEATEVGQHIAICVSCSALMRTHCELRTLLEPSGDRLSPEIGFICSVMDRCSASDARVVPFYRKAWFYATASIAAAAALCLSQPRVHSDPDVVAARGTSSRDSMTVTPDVLLLRGNTLLPIEGAVLHPGDGITVRYWNPSQEPAYLAVFVLDAAAAVHWVYPAYLNESDDPKSIVLQRSVEGTILAEAVEPELPAPGRLRIVALLTPAPLHVHDIETRLGRVGHSINELFPEARVHEWNCQWIER
jgi:hypothetical protein